MIDMTEKYKERIEQARMICAQLIPQYNASICDFDPTTVIVFNITDKQHSALCRKMCCSGFYSEACHAGFLTNFGYYK